MECDICNNYLNDTFDLDVNNGKIQIVITCNKCGNIFKTDIKYNNNYIKNKKIPLHLIKYNYCGPFTNVIKNILTDVKPYNEIDKQCLLHDIQYHIYKNSYKRNRADKNLLHYLRKCTKKSINKYIIKFILKNKIFF